jgi:hypothetical protein
METEEGDIKYTDLLSGPKQIKAFITFLSGIIFLILVAIFGLFLWNQGLQPAFPGLVAPIGRLQPLPQSPNPFFQLAITLLALIFIF